MSLIIVDTGCANLASVQYAFERLGVEPVITDVPDVISAAERVVLPGVGSAPFAMKSLDAKGLKPVLQPLRSPSSGFASVCSYSSIHLKKAEKKLKALALFPEALELLIRTTFRLRIWDGIHSRLSKKTRF